MSSIKKWLNDEVLKDGKIVSSRSKERWFVSNGFKAKLDEIIERTRFLNSASMSERIWCILLDLKQVPSCYCGNSVKFSSARRRYSKYCSNICSKNDPIVKNEWIAKQTATCLARYGTKYPAQLQEFEVKKSATNVSKYGFNTPLKSKNIQDKIAATNRERYGYDNAGSSRLIIDKRRATIQERYGVDSSSPFAVASIMEGVKVFDSKPEAEIREFFKGLEYDFKHTKQALNGTELDGYCEELNIAFELNGLFWHSDARNGDYKNRHLKKLLQCEERGIRLIQLWDSEWYKKRMICESILRNAVGKSNRVIYARNCSLRETPLIEYRSFLDTNHIQGFSPAKIKLGLYLNDELVQLIGLGSARYNKNHDLELIRSCSLLNTRIVGGLSKLLSNLDESIVSYSDRRLFSGSSLQHAGFAYVGTTRPNYYYFKPRDYILRSRVGFQKHKLKGKLEVYNDAFSEYSNMKANGYCVVYDCGNSIWSRS